MGLKVRPSCPAQVTIASVPGPITTPLGMQFGTGKLLITAGPYTVAPLAVMNGWNGSISSTLPIVTSALEFALVSRKCPVFGLKTDPPNPAIPIAPAQPAGVPGPGGQKAPPT